MPKDKSLFERLDDISATQEEILSAISGVGEKTSKSDARYLELEQRLSRLENQSKVPAPTITRSAQPSEPPVKTFARKAKKSWRWFGNRRQFIGSKALAIIFSFLMLALGITSTVITGISCGMYSPFSSIENIWLIFALIYLIFACKAPILYEVNAFASGTPLRGERDDVGMVFPNGGEKKVFKIFRWITIIIIPFNIIWIWINKSDISWLATLFEILFALSIIAAFFINIALYAQYCICWLEGHNLVTGQKVTLLKMPGAKNFSLEKEVREKIPQLFE